MTKPKRSGKKLDFSQNALRTVQLATGQIEGATEREMTPAQKFAQSGGLVGGKARAEKLTKAERRAIAVKAAKARWAKTVENSKSLSRQ